jgi:cyanophycin synthetase
MAFEDIRILRVTFLRGPNLWTYRSALETWLDLGPLEQQHSASLPGFLPRLRAALPALEEHHCGVGERGGFLQRLQEGTWMGHVLEHIVIELLNLAGMPTGFGQTRSTRTPGVYRMVFRARDEAVARHALALGHRLLMNAINDQPVDATADVAALRETIDSAWLGPSTAHIVASATERGIPHLRLNGGNLVQLGHGASQRRIWTAETDHTSAIAQGIAGDKALTKRLLGELGVAVPIGEVAPAVEQAWDIAQDVGLPVVVKPTDANHGRGVSLDLSTRHEIEAAWRVADAEGSEVIIERYIPGDEHRLLVVGGKVVAAARGESLWVIGDGRSTVEQLIDDQLNTDPRRGDAEEFPLETLILTREPVIQLLLQRQGLSGTSVPAPGRRVLIQRSGNVSIDCTDEVHPEVARVVSLAARVVGLDVAGIDVVTTNVAQPFDATGGAIVEVNAGPGLLMHLKPATGSPRPVGKAIVDHLFPADESGRIPIIGVTGGANATAACRLIAWLLQLAGHHIGLASRDGLHLGSRCTDAGDATRHPLAERLLINRDTTAAVFENPAAVILDQGLAYDRCAVGVVTDLEGWESLGHHDVATAQDMPRVLRTQMDVVLDDGVGVLNADEPAIAALACHCDGETVLYATQAEVLRAHCTGGGRAVLYREGRYLLIEGTGEARISLPDPVAQASGLAPAVLLPALAAGWALGLTGPQLSAGVQSFPSQASFSAATSPVSPVSARELFRPATQASTEPPHAPGQTNEAADGERAS